MNAENGPIPMDKLDETVFDAIREKGIDFGAPHTVHLIFIEDDSPIIIVPDPVLAIRAVIHEDLGADRLDGHPRHGIPWNMVYMFSYSEAEAMLATISAAEHESLEIDLKTRSDIGDDSTYEVKSIEVLK